MQATHKLLPEDEQIGPQTEIVKSRLAPAIERYRAEAFVGLGDAWREKVRQCLNVFELFVGKRPITAKVYGDWIQHCLDGHWADSMAHKAIDITRAFMEWCEANGYIDKSPHHLIKVPKLKPREPRKSFTPEEIVRIKKAAEGTKLHWLFILADATGMRMSDCCMFQWAFVDIDGLTLAVSQYKLRHKSGKKATIPFEPGSELHEALLAKAANKSDPNTWPNNPALGIHYVDTDLATIYKCNRTMLKPQVDKVFRQAHIPDGKTFHSFRATMCSLLANSGMNTALACAVTGHVSPAIFTQYVTPDRDSLARELKKARMLRDQP